MRGPEVRSAHLGGRVIAQQWTQTASLAVSVAKGCTYDFKVRSSSCAIPYLAVTLFWQGLYTRKEIDTSTDCQHDGRKEQDEELKVNLWWKLQIISSY